MSVFFPHNLEVICPKHTNAFIIACYHYHRMTKLCGSTIGLFVPSEPHPSKNAETMSQELQAKVSMVLGDQSSHVGHLCSSYLCSILFKTKQIKIYIYIYKIYQVHNQCVFPQCSFFLPFHTNMLVPTKWLTLTIGTVCCCGTHFLRPTASPSHSDQTSTNCRRVKGGSQL